MLRIIALVAFALALAPYAHADSVIHIADRDCNGLVDAVSSAPAGETTTIVLARGGTYPTLPIRTATMCGLHVLRGNVVVEGAGATLSSGLCGSGLVAVDVGANLTVRNANFIAQDCGLGNQLGKDVLNQGTLALESVALQINSAQNDADASLTMRNVTVEATGTIDNAGTMSVLQSSVLSTTIRNGPGATLAVGNSVLLSGFASCAVDGSAESLGGNVVASACGWALASDHRTNAATVGLGPFQPNGALGILTAAPSATSIVRGAAISANCEPTDARGVVRPQGACDAGAAQFDSAKDVGNGGMNGVWYDHAADGHYVTIQRVHDNDTALVIWNTFDSNGKQAWIYGVGHVSGRHLHVDMSQNVGGRLQPGGAPTGSSVHAWGTVDIDLSSCLQATMSYRSTIPGFGSGSFPLDRLAYVSDFGCAD